MNLKKLMARNGKIADSQKRHRIFDTVEEWKDAFTIDEATDELKDFWKDGGYDMKDIAADFVKCFQTEVASVYNSLQYFLKKANDGEDVLPDIEDYSAIRKDQDKATELLQEAFSYIDVDYLIENVFDVDPEGYIYTLCNYYYEQL